MTFGLFYVYLSMKYNYEKAINYYLDNSSKSIKQISEIFCVNRKTLARKLNQLGIDISRVPVKEFINISSKIHNNKYDYSKVNGFKTVKDKVEIICPVHGSFMQDIYNHKKGRGCPKCATKVVSDKTRMTDFKFISKAKYVHGEKYDYSKVVLERNNKKVIISCIEHGDFTQTPDKHLQGRGCPVCAEESKGWSKTNWKSLFKSEDKAKFYVLLCKNDLEEFVKIGRTKNTISERYSTKKSMPYNYEVLKVVEDSPDEIWDLELFYKRKFKNCKYSPEIYFAGYTECFTKDVLFALEITS